MVVGDVGSKGPREVYTTGPVPRKSYLKSIFISATWNKKREYNDHDDSQLLYKSNDCPGRYFLFFFSPADQISLELFWPYENIGSSELPRDITKKKLKKYTQYPPL